MSNGEQVIVNGTGMPMQGVNFKMRMLDGEHAGEIVQQTHYTDPRVSWLYNQLDRKDAEIGSLRSELNQYKASGRVMSSICKIELMKDEKNFTDIKRYQAVDMGNDFNCIRNVMTGFEGVCRAKFGKALSKEYVNHVAAYLAQEYFHISYADAQAKLNLSGDAKDSHTITVQTIRDLVKAFEFVVTDTNVCLTPQRKNEYADKIKQIADSENLNENVIFFCYLGEICTDSRIYSELIRDQQFTDSMSQFQLTFLYAMEVLSDFPMLLDEPAEKLTGFISAVKTGREIEETVATFTAERFQNAVSGVASKKNEEVLNDRFCCVLEFCISNPDGVSTKAIMEHIKDSSKSRVHKTVITPLLERKLIEFTHRDATSSNQKYRITAAGVTALQAARPGRTYSLLCQSVPAADPADPNAKKE